MSETGRDTKETGSEETGSDPDLVSEVARGG